ncbi:hypothetical protein PFICI_11856 [Pestalotiopsis fici W106-1]|uniref:Glucose-methanol-choline oxidoreductase N-terminal domain-containing protein n=1 Tax=Pestalotiopsis fici (strain W106-1 / CGMCC3.15140) TaxID=1229662 RepID=W3WRK1_PESFW|nr:uncharacterized protein PFICI_11856 [Pestalotiopsis fici W106-1]ETS76469.1 hypothetical protein PFICI_11856 [Pestalotiopsis fici W106-1]
MGRSLLRGFTAALGLALGVSATCQEVYDYIVVGGGPAGIITAERLAEAQKKVLLIERGSGPTAATGSNHTLSWNDTLTEIDVPGLSADIGGLDVWTEYICSDVPNYAACVLGGGVTVNYMVFVHPPAHDFEKWPKGWNWDDVASAAERLYERNPGTTLPSADGQRYDQQLYSILSNFFDNLGWKSVDMSEQPDEKFEVYSYPAWNIKDGKRAGPVRTYLPLAEELDNFTLQLHTKVLGLVRSGSQVTGVEVETSNGTRKTIGLAEGGRVVLSAGALSTPRILYNSGIGPQAQLMNVSVSNVSTLPPQDQWLDLPVGATLMDHPIFAIQVQTNGTFGMADFDAILNGTDASVEPYETINSGLLTEGKHRAIFFTSNVGADNITRYYQGSCAPTGEGIFTITSYMTHGLTSSGSLGIDTNGNTIVTSNPYMQTAGDQQAAKMFIQSMVDAITAPGTGLTLISATNTSAIYETLTIGDHFVGTAKMGTDDGRKNGTSVVDTNAKVYGMDNLFITDASIHPDLPTGNLQATVMVAAEAAVAKILAYE